MTAQLAWKGEEVVRAVHGECLHEQDWRADGVSIDSRSVKPGDIFVALVGPMHDGHTYVSAAFEKGATAAIVAHQPAQIPQKAPLIFVPDTFKALELLGKAGRERSTAKIVAVTGSVGKTGTKEMLRLMLGAVGETHANEGSLNNQWGVPLSLARMPADAVYGVFELGMNHAGELTGLSRQVLPDVAMITTIDAVHLEFFSSLEAIADAKAEIFLGMDAEGAAVLNRDNSQYARLASAARTHGLKQVLSFGRDLKCDGKMLEYKAVPEGGRIKADILGHKITYLLSAPGEHLALNSVGALLSAVVAGGDREVCAGALAHFEQPKGRGVVQTVEMKKGRFTLIDESYNASPAAVRAAIHVLGHMTPESGGRKILVLGDMKELGAASPALHAELAKDIVEAKIAAVYCCGEMMAHLYAALPPSLRGHYAQDSAGLAAQIAGHVHAGDIVTVKGSHSMNMNVIIDALRALGASAG